MRAAVDRHDAILRKAIEDNGGAVFRTMGDAFCAAFSSASQGLSASVEAQRALFAEPWGADTGPLRVRMGLHTGLGELGGSDYMGPPLNKVARLMSAGQGGQVLVSASTYDLSRDTLPLGVYFLDLGEHRLKDLQRPEHIFQLVIPGLPAEFPPIKTLDVHPNNLPIQRNFLVGREGELAAARQLLLRDDVGLLTLVGPGGIGKTTFALQIAAEVADRFEDGVFFVSLAPITNPDLVVPSIAQVLAVREIAGRSMLSVLKDYLQNQRLLLVIDNFEQVIEAASELADLLSGARHLKAIVTSREVLHLRGEQEFVVPPLSLPNPRHLPPLESLSQYQAVALFIQRARLVKADFEVTNQNAPAVAEICYRLEGLPLAIELAAARIRLLPPQALLERLTSRLKLLTGGARDLPARQQTLRGAIQWSYDLLQPVEQTLLTRLSVFKGGCSLEAVEAVCNAAGDIEIDTLDGIASLVDKSLVRQEMGVGGEPRLYILDTICEFAWEQLQSRGPEATEQLLLHHARYYMEMAERTDENLDRGKSREWLDHLEEEHDNLRSALTWTLDTRLSEIAIRLSAALWWFWNTRGYGSEGLALMERAIALEDASAYPVAYAYSLMGAAELAWRIRDYEKSKQLANESVATWQGMGELDATGRRGLGYALITLGIALEYLGDHAGAQQPNEEGARLLREVGDLRGLAVALLDLGLVANSRGDYAASRAALSEGLEVTRGLGDRWGAAQVLNTLGDLERIEGDYPQAEERYEESLAIYRELSMRVEIPATLHNLGYTALARGDSERAETLFREGLPLQIEYNDRHGIIECISGLASVAGFRGQGERAARLFGAANALHEATGGPVWPAERIEMERQIAAARAKTDQATWDKAWAEGRQMSLEQAIGYALEQG